MVSTMLLGNRPFPFFPLTVCIISAYSISTSAARLVSDSLFELAADKHSFSHRLVPENLEIGSPGSIPHPRKPYSGEAEDVSDNRESGRLERRKWKYSSRSRSRFKLKPVENKVWQQREEERDFSWRKALTTVGGTTSNLTDAIALLAFKSTMSATVAAESPLKSWNLTNIPNVCLWDKVNCSSSGRVTEVQLSAVHYGDQGSPGGDDLIPLVLDGSLPVELGLLDKLQVLDLTANSLTGSIPPELGNLTSLRKLLLSTNLLQTAIPKELGQLSNLEVLDLGRSLLYWVDAPFRNFYGGTHLPPELSELSKLEYLSVNNSFLGGSLPASFGKLQALTYLDLNFNNLYGSIPSEIGNLSSLVYLKLSYNNFSGTLPPELGSLSKLEYLDLGENNFESGSQIPETYANLSSLRGCYLNYTNLGGPIPAFFGSLPHLDWLDLSDNFFTSIPDKLGDFHGKDLYLFNNLISGPIPDLGQMPEIQVLGLWNNLLSGTLPLSLVGVQNTLYSLNLAQNNISGEIPPEYGELMVNSFDSYYSEYYHKRTITARGIIDLSYNQLSGPVPKELAILGIGLNELHLENNKLNGTVPEALSNLTQLGLLDLSSNSLSGELSDRIFSGMKLDTLNLTGNKFSGALPIGFCSDDSPLDFWAGGNQFNGSVPAKIKLCKGLTDFHANDNDLSGLLPESFCEVTSINNVGLQNNFLEGSLPACLSKLENIVTLNLANNSFGGEIPAIWNGELAEPSNPVQVFLNDCNFSGSIPPVNSSRHWTISSLDLDNNHLQGVIPPSLSYLQSELNTLSLSGNNLNGSLDILAALPNLVSFDATGNNFTGGVPGNVSSVLTLAELQLAGNPLGGGLPESLATLTGLQVLNLSYASLTGPIPSILTSMTTLTSLSLKGNQLSGSIPSGFDSLSAIESLDLSNNLLSGDIPVSFASLAHLTFLNVSDNNLMGTIPGGNLTRFNATSFEGNSAGLCSSPLAACPVPVSVSSGSSGLSGAAIAGIVCGSLAIILLLVALVLWYFCGAAMAVDRGEFKLYQKTDAPFSLQDIKDATNNFSDDFLLGRGGFGSVYRAKLEKANVDLAVKRMDHGGGQGMKELQTEMELLGNLKHKNVVILYGSYIDRTESLLFYELLPNGDLSDLLNPAKAKGAFNSWAVRNNALLGTARGLKYLHCDAPLPIVHRDIKPQNVLFDAELEARIADFGLSRTMDIDKEALETGLSGTVGYLAPEYIHEGKCSTASDVYAFGVLLFQVVTGRKPTESAMAEHGMPTWISQNLVKNGIKALVDPGLELQKGEEAQLIGLLRIGILCTSRSPKRRPDMEEIVHFIETLDTYEHTGEGLGALPGDRMVKVQPRDENAEDEPGVSILSMSSDGGQSFNTPFHAQQMAM
eukprot:TRINITY_DN136_c0_g1_i2.p1 TRINITY_DN136_c0_g1~~TRINITY_DN136_c0_g1_i2.p1  ORF type:complete len:1384 (-),score=195.73 TRINITY_DN136_c0_g1_i2:1351-5502(-)